MCMSLFRPGFLQDGEKNIYTSSNGDRFCPFLFLHYSFLLSLCPKSPACRHSTRDYSLLYSLGTSRGIGSLSCKCKVRSPPLTYIEAETSTNLRKPCYPVPPALTFFSFSFCTFFCTRPMYPSGIGWETERERERVLMAVRIRVLPFTSMVEKNETKEQVRRSVMPQLLFLPFITFARTPYIRMNTE